MVRTGHRAGRSPRSGAPQEGRSRPPANAVRPRTRRRGETGDRWPTDAEPRMDGGAERNEGHAGLAVGIVVLRRARRPGHRHPIVGIGDVVRVVLARRGLQAEAGRRRQRQDGDAGEDERQDHEDRLGRTEDASRQRQDAVAQDAAEAARQRPAVGGGQRGGERGRPAAAGDQQDQAQARMGEASAREQGEPPAEDRRQQRHDGDADDLHDEVRHHGPGGTGEVVDGPAGGVVPARVLHRPGGQGQADGADAAQQQQPAEFGEAPTQELARGLGHDVDRRKRGDAHGRPGFSPMDRSATRGSTPKARRPAAQAPWLRPISTLDRYA